MIDIFRIKFPKERLRELSTEERSLFFLLGYVANQISVFKKLCVYSSNRDAEPAVQSRVEGAQTHIIVRQFIGIVSEGWELINRRYIQKAIAKEYQDRLGPLGKNSLAALKSHFGGSNVLNRIRNNFAFHHPYEAEVDAGFECALASSDFDDEWNWYLAKENINCFYFISDVVVAHGMLTAIGETDVVEAQKKMHRELNLVADNVVKFVQAFFDALLTKYFSPEIIAECCEKVMDAPKAFDVALPFYVEPSPDKRLAS